MHSLDFPIGLSHRPRDRSVVSSLHCMNDPQPEGHMASHIARRKFLATLGGAAAAWPLAARAQQGGKFSRRGLAANDPAFPITGGGAAFVEGLRENGFVEGKNIVIERRFAEGRSDRAVALIAELVRDNIDLLVTSGAQIHPA